MLSHCGTLTVSVGLLTFEGKYTFSGYLLHVPCFGISLPMLCFVWEHAVQSLDNRRHYRVRQRQAVMSPSSLISSLEHK